MRRPKKQYRWKQLLSQTNQKDLEDDFAKGNYQKWVEQYPDHVYDIFAEYLSLDFQNPVTLQDIQYFQKHGVDLNRKSRAFYYSDNSEPSAFEMACEWRRLDLMKLMLQAGADVNLINDNDMAPLDSVVLGHYGPPVYKYQLHPCDYCGDCKVPCTGTENYSAVQECLALLVTYGVKRQVGLPLDEIVETLQRPEAGPWLNEYFTNIPVRGYSEEFNQKMGWVF